MAGKELSAEARREEEGTHSAHWVRNNVLLQSSDGIPVFKEKNSSARVRCVSSRSPASLADPHLPVRALESVQTRLACGVRLSRNNRLDGVLRKAPHLWISRQLRFAVDIRGERTLVCSSPRRRMAREDWLLKEDGECLTASFTMVVMAASEMGLDALSA